MIVKPSLLDHPKFLRLYDMLGPESLYLLLRVWAHCEIDRRMEVWSNKDPAYLEAVARWRGAPGVAFEALHRSGFVDWDGTTIRIHDWDENNASMTSRWRNGTKGGRGARNLHHAEQPKPNSVPAVQDPEQPKPNSVPAVQDPVEPKPGSGPLERREGKRREVEDTLAREAEGPLCSVVDLPPFAEAPSLEEVLAFGSGFRGEPSSGAPGPIDPEYCLSWWERKDNSRSGGWSTLLDWRRALVSSWRSDFRKTFWKQAAKQVASTQACRDRAESVPLGIRIRELEKSADEHVGNPENTRGTLEAKEKARPEWLSLKRQLRQLRTQLAGMGNEA